MTSRKLLRHVDRSLGRIAALILGTYESTAGHLRRRQTGRPPDEAAPKNILAIKMVGIGDTVLMLTPLRRLREHFPDTRISALVTPLSSGVIAGQPLVDEVIVYDVFGKHKGIIGLIRLIRALRSMRFDSVLDFEQYFQATAVLSYLSAAGRRIGFYYDDEPRKRLYTDPVFLDPDRHMVDSYVRLLEPLGIEAQPVEKLEGIFIDASDEQEVATWLRAHEITEDDLLVGIHAGSGPRAPYKRWDRGRFAEIVRRLRDEHGAVVVLTGDSGEQNLNEEIIRLAGDRPVLNTAGRFSIKQTAALIRRCDLFVSNDTGPMHIAAAVGTPTIGIFGPELPVRYGPVGPKNAAVHKKLDCTPCVHIYRGKVYDCDDPVCMRQIRVEDVWDEIQRCDLKRPN